MNEPTHAFVGYGSDGTPLEIFVDDGSRDSSHAAVQFLRNGWHFERMTLEDARKVQLYERPVGR